MTKKEEIRMEDSFDSGEWESIMTVDLKNDIMAKAKQALESRKETK